MGINSVLIVIIGAYGLIAQVVFMRTLSQVFYGNELSLGIILFLWLFFNGIGTFLGQRFLKKIQTRSLPFIVGVIILGSTILMPCLLFGLSIIRPVYGFLPGELVTVPFIFVISAACLILHSMAQGILFCYVCKLAPTNTSTAIPFSSLVNNVYILESLGAFIGGLYYYLIGRIFLIPAANIFAVNIFYCLVVIIFLAKNKVSVLRFIGIFIVCIHVIGFLLAPSFDELFLKNLYAPLPVLASINTKLGDSAVIKQSTGEFSLFRDGVLEDESGNEFASEELAYYGLLQFDTLPSKILVLGGGYCSLIPKLSLIPGATMTVVEPDNKLVDFLKDETRSHLPNAELLKRVDFKHDTIHTFLSRCNERFDYVIAASPPPYTLALNRFYTSEFYCSVRDILKPNGIFCFRVPSSENIINDALADFLRAVDNSTKQAFSHSFIVPGSTNIFILSNSRNGLITDPVILSTRSQSLPFEARFINPGYIPYQVTNERIAYQKERLRSSSFTKINSSFHPIAFYFDFILWSSKTSQTLKHILLALYALPFYQTILILGFILSALSLTLSKRTHTTTQLIFAITSLGFTEISLEITLLLAYQSLFGHVYSALALLIACYMAGLIMGSVVFTHIFAVLKNISFGKLLPICSAFMALFCL
ncbi:MAG: hypothetical protein JW938_07630, partial [Candidatus Omnitrophica bacterium]|nr:hypothetical protein [Candidatus Omnitrophota bacterium]